MAPNTSSLRTDRPAVLFDLDGTLLDSVYQHVLAWKEALESAGIPLSIWRIHRRIGMSGGLFVRALVRETGRELTAGEADRLRQLHEEALGRAITDSFVVGDSVWDMLAAQRAQALGIGVLSGGYGREELETAGAYRSYDDPLDLLEHLDELGIRTR